MICQVLEFLCLDLVLGIYPLAEWLHCNRVFHIFNRLGVYSIYPVMIHKAWFWTWSRACWFIFDMFNRVVVPYSRWGRTVPSYTLFRIFSISLQLVSYSFCVMANLRLASVSPFWISDFQVCFLSNVTPRYVASSSFFSDVFPIF